MAKEPDLNELFQTSVNEAEVAAILGVLAAPPNRRDEPIEGDLEGEYDFWFDGGACLMQTGFSTYEFADGTEVVSHHKLPWRLDLEISFEDGRTVKIRQTGPEL